MQKKKVTSEQAKIMLNKLYPISDYVAKLKEGLEKAELTNDGRVYEKTKDVYNAMLSLCIELCEVRNRG